MKKYLSKSFFIRIVAGAYLLFLFCCCPSQLFSQPADLIRGDFGFVNHPDAKLRVDYQVRERTRRGSRVVERNRFYRGRWDKDATVRYSGKRRMISGEEWLLFETRTRYGEPLRGFVKARYFSETPWSQEAPDFAYTPSQLVIAKRHAELRKARQARSSTAATSTAQTPRSTTREPAPKQAPPIAQNYISPANSERPKANQAQSSARLSQPQITPDKGKPPPKTQRSGLNTTELWPPEDEWVEYLVYFLTFCGLGIVGLVARYVISPESGRRYKKVMHDVERAYARAYAFRSSVCPGADILHQDYSFDPFSAITFSGAKVAFPKRKKRSGWSHAFKVVILWSFDSENVSNINIYKSRRGDGNEKLLLSCGDKRGYFTDVDLKKGDAYALYFDSRVVKRIDLDDLPAIPPVQCEDIFEEEPAEPAKEEEVDNEPNENPALQELLDMDDEQYKKRYLDTVHDISGEYGEEILAAYPEAVIFPYWVYERKSIKSPPLPQGYRDLEPLVFVFGFVQEESGTRLIWRKPDDGKELRCVRYNEAHQVRRLFRTTHAEGEYVDEYTSQLHYYFFSHDKSTTTFEVYYTTVVGIDYKKEMAERQQEQELDDLAEEIVSYKEILLQEKVRKLVSELYARDDLSKEEIEELVEERMFEHRSDQSRGDRFDR